MSTPVPPQFDPNQPPPQPPAAPAYTGAPAPAPAAQPGRTLGIVGLILAFLLPVIGMILGIVAVVQSKKAGAKNGLGVAAIIVGAVLTLFWIIGMILFVTAMSAIGGSVLDAAEACANGAESVEVAGQLISCADVLSQ